MARSLLIIVLLFNVVLGYTTLSQDTLANWLKTSPPFDFVLIDVRSAGEISGMIGNKRCKPYNIAWTSTFKQYAPMLLKQQYIVLYCQSGNRAGQAARYLDSLGYEHVMMVGGFPSWAGREDSLKVTLSDTMSVSQLPAVSMKAAGSGTLNIASVAKVHNVLHANTIVMINQSVKPVQAGRYFTSDGRIIPVIPGHTRRASLVVVSKNIEY
ncbi:MAG TPA: rhodanese-like domain-containing protein [Chitinispirillaceae bacterium]|nr:rhodanese-like domain-containing protein [Chitinispirillaceae bacterium]